MCSKYMNCIVDRNSTYKNPQLHFVKQLLTKTKTH
ncbi:hypothetical protein LINPERHAP1_LOCUS23124 [Linum perenne]